jgi:hypothetical protein
VSKPEASRFAKIRTDKSPGGSNLLGEDRKGFDPLLILSSAMSSASITFANHIWISSVFG